MHLKALRIDCQDCGARAFVELVNERNAVLGRFCRACGQYELERQLRRRAERQADTHARATE